MAAPIWLPIADSRSSVCGVLSIRPVMYNNPKTRLRLMSGTQAVLPMMTARALCAVCSINSRSGEKSVEEGRCTATVCSPVCERKVIAPRQFQRGQHDPARAKTSGNSTAPIFCDTA
jgi:hypothetical protein